MKKMYLSVLAVATVLLTSCGETAETATETKYALDNKATTLNWTGKYVADGHTHTGTVDVTKGSMTYKGEEFVSGDFTVDLATLSATDVSGEMKEHLDQHLKSADYFNNTKVNVVVNEVTAKEIKATLKLLGKEVEAVMPVKISKDEKSLTAKGTFSIDFAVLDLKGFKAAPGDAENMHPETNFAFDLNLVLKTK